MKKKQFLIFWLTLLLFSVFHIPIAFAQPTIPIILDGQPLVCDTPPFIEQGVTLVPLRTVFEALDATVTWDANKQTVTGQKDATVITLKVNDTNGYVGERKVSLAAPAQNKQGRVFVPLRFIAESFGCDVQWDSASPQITIESRTLEVSPTCQVIRVVDGDTIVVLYQGQEEKVRLIGVDTPESVHPDAEKNNEAGKTASDYTKAQLTGKDVQLEFDVQKRDKYQRLLAYVYVDGTMFNKTLLAEGIAKLATFPPNVKYVDEFTAIEKEAQKAGIGLWEGYVVKDSGNYVASKNSTKYHLLTCNSASKINADNKIWFDTATEAEAAGYTPCSVCQP